MTSNVEPERSCRNWLRPPRIYLLILLATLASLPITAYEQWSGPTPGWAAPAFSFIGSIVFCDWIASGAPSSPGPHDVDLGRSEIIACAVGFLANVLLIAGLILGPLGARRVARSFGRAALCLGLASIILMKSGATSFQPAVGAYLWLAAMVLLACSRLNKPAPVP
jgi:hypothetical protein